jgi:hypothetical protein
MCIVSFVFVVEKKSSALQLVFVRKCIVMRSDYKEHSLFTKEHTVAGKGHGNIFSNSRA